MKNRIKERIEESGFSSEEAEEVMTLLKNFVWDELLQKQKCKIPGVGLLKIKECRGKKVVDNLNNRTYYKGSMNNVVFTPEKSLVDKINGN